MKCPCKECENRRPGCHDKCEGYSKWKAEHLRIKKKRNDEAALDVYFNLPEHWMDHK